MYVAAAAAVAILVAALAPRVGPALSDPSPPWLIAMLTLLIALAGQLEQVYVNILANAIHATPERGTIVMGCALEDGMATSYVTDSGGGIPLDIQDRVFEPFFTTKIAEAGARLGLFDWHKKLKLIHLVATANEKKIRQHGRCIHAKRDSSGNRRRDFGTKCPYQVHGNG